MPNGEISPVAAKREGSRDENLSPLGSLQGDEDILERRESTGTRLGLDGNPIQKRKGGRKPLYATTEERKQRNRRAQAAFRERRTEHIKQLETDIKHMQDTVDSLEKSHQRAKDECLMLRYKNSLLENILLQKNIDFQKEIQQSGMAYSPQQLPRNPVPLHRAVHQQRMRPAPISVGKQSPLLGATQSGITSPIQPQPPQSAFTFSHSGFPQQSPQMTGQAGFLAGSRQAGQTTAISSAMSSPANTRRPSMTQWTVGSFQGELDPSVGHFSLDAEALSSHQPSPHLQGQQYPGLAGSQPQYNLMAQAQFGASQPTIGQVLEQGGHPQRPIHQQQQQQQGRQPSQQSGVQQQNFGMMGQDLSTFGLTEAALDPFGIDRSMHYPTQFDFTGSQRRQA